MNPINIAWSIIAARFKFSDSKFVKKKYPEPPDESFMPTPGGFADRGLQDGRIFHLARFYWKCFDFNNPICTEYPIVVEHVVIDHIYLLSLIPEKTAYLHLLDVLEQAGCNHRVFGLFITLYGKNLCDPKSPIRNPKLFIHAAGYILYHPDTPEENKWIIRHRLNMARIIMKK